MRGALATLDDEAALAEIASGTLSKTIAARYGVTPYAVRKRLAQHPDYKTAIAEQAESLVEIATDLAMTCSDKDVAIARVRVDAAHKWAAARDPARWGPRQQLEVGVQFEVIIQRGAAVVQEQQAQRTIESECSIIEQVVPK